MRALSSLSLFLPFYSTSPTSTAALTPVVQNKLPEWFSSLNTEMKKAVDDLEYLSKKIQTNLLAEQKLFYTNQKLLETITPAERKKVSELLDNEIKKINLSFNLNEKLYETELKKHKLNQASFLERRLAIITSLENEAKVQFAKTHQEAEKNHTNYWFVPRIPQALWKSTVVAESPDEVARKVGAYGGFLHKFGDFSTLEGADGLVTGCVFRAQEKLSQRPISYLATLVEQSENKKILSELKELQQDFNKDVLNYSYLVDGPGVKTVRRVAKELEFILFDKKSYEHVKKQASEFSSKLEELADSLSAGSDISYSKINDLRKDLASRLEKLTSELTKSLLAFNSTPTNAVTDRIRYFDALKIAYRNVMKSNDDLVEIQFKIRALYLQATMRYGETRGQEYKEFEETSVRAFGRLHKARDEAKKTIDLPATNTWIIENRNSVIAEQMLQLLKDIFTKDENIQHWHKQISKVSFSSIGGYSVPKGVFQMHAKLLELAYVKDPLVVLAALKLVATGRNASTINLFRLRNEMTTGRCYAALSNLNLLKLTQDNFDTTVQMFKDLGFSVPTFSGSKSDQKPAPDRRRKG